MEGREIRRGRGENGDLTKGEGPMAKSNQAEVELLLA